MTKNIMKFKFTKNLDYQLDAINAILGVFDTGKNISKSDGGFDLQSYSNIISNDLEINPKRILENLHAIQKQNNIEIESVPKLKIDGKNFLNIGDGFGLSLGDQNISDFSIEMETGTGKTYVYLRTALELNQKYGLKKFIILVPSVAIREGVLKTIEQTKDHFRSIYGTGFGSFAYDSGKLSQVRDFAQSLDMQIMIMTIQSFNSDTNVMKQSPDRFHGERPIDIVAKTRPVIIMDEPQNMESELSKSAIEELKPLFKLRYSATHKHVHNLVYRLGPVDAYRQGLVKKVEVYGTETANPGNFVFAVKEIITKKGEAPKARVVLEIKNTDGTYSKKEALLKQRDDLEIKSKRNEKYKDLQVGNIDAMRGFVELSNGEEYKLVEDTLENKEAIFRTQIRETIRAHIQKQEDLGGRIKVLSLFFIDKVENYRGENPLIYKIFEEEFELQKKKSEWFKNSEVSQVHKGYFSQDWQNKGLKTQEVNTEGKREKLTYDLIMKNKEQLLSFNEPTAFIFSHSALKEGWDNPNIFQICTLIESKDDFTKRQKIGRGLRLPVDINGDRVYDSAVNILTVIANESYEDFARGLQNEYTEAGYESTQKPPNARERTKVTFKKTIAVENEDFKHLWERIKQKTTWKMNIDTESLIKDSIEKIDETISFGKTTVLVNKAQLEMDPLGNVKTVFKNQSIGERIEINISIGNIIDRIARETFLTRTTIYKILSDVSNLDLVFKNPEEYVRGVILTIEACKNELLMKNGIEYLPTDDAWEIGKFKDFDSYISKLLEVKKSNKTLYDYIPYDSDGERKFAENLELANNVAFFAKLPEWFVIDTFIGEYNPDWAVVFKEDDGHKLYLVRETKFVDDLENLRPSEQIKIACGKKHFKAIGLESFKVSTKSDLIDLK